MTQTLNQTEQTYYQATIRHPDDPETHYNLGNFYFETQRFKSAIEAYSNALKLAPNHPQILLQLGNCHSAISENQHALDFFKQAISSDIDNVAAYFNAGNALRELGRSADAESAYREVLKRTPDDAEAHNNLGNVLREQGHLKEAINHYSRAFALDPTLYHAKVHDVHQRQHICDWVNLDADISEIRRWVCEIPVAQISPFAFLSMPGTTMAEQLKCSSNWLNNKYNHIIKIEKSEIKNKKIKLAYLSNDLRLHPLAFLITEVIESHNRSLFEIFAYSSAPDDSSEEQKRLKKAFDHFIDIRSMSLEAAAAEISRENIDILIDLTGYTQTSRSGIAAYGPAKVHVNWLGFPGTMGYQAQNTPLFDYIIGDDWVIPHNAELHFAEKIVRLPCYQPNNRSRPVAEIPSRKSCGLPEDVFVFCCFNQSFKITPTIFSTWMRILQAVPDSVLWLLDCNKWANENLRHAATIAGVNAERLIFAARTPIHTHIARHAHADLFLDTVPYNAHTTCADALWMGVPVLTCTGDTFASRVAASLLDECGLNELITDNLQTYYKHAIHLANKPEMLSALKAKLQALATSALFQPERFVKKLEQAYLGMLE